MMNNNLIYFIYFRKYIWCVWVCSLPRFLVPAWLVVCMCVCWMRSRASFVHGMIQFDLFSFVLQHIIGFPCISHQFSYVFLFCFLSFSDYSSRFSLSSCAFIGFHYAFTSLMENFFSFSLLIASQHLISRLSCGRLHDSVQCVRCD